MSNMVFETPKVDYSFKILESILMLRSFKDKDEVLKVANAMSKVADESPKYSASVKTSYKEACNKLNSLTFEEMQEIITILKSDED